MACSLESLHSAEISYGPWRCQHFPHSPLLAMLLLLPLWSHLTWGLSLDIPVRSVRVWVCLCSGLHHASVLDGSVLGGSFLCHPYWHLLGDKEQVSEKGWVTGQDMVYRVRAAKMVPKKRVPKCLMKYAVCPLGGEAACAYRSLSWTFMWVHGHEEAL